MRQRGADLRHRQRTAVTLPYERWGNSWLRVRMVTVTIGSDSRTGEEADPQWVTQEINRRRQDGQAVCVRVQIHEDGVAVALSTPSCSGLTPWTCCSRSA